MKAKLTSRKFWCVIAGVLYTTLTEAFGCDIPQEVYWTVWGILGTYIFGEAIVDMRRNKK